MSHDLLVQMAYDKSDEQKQQLTLKAKFYVQTVVTGFQSKDDSGRSYYPTLK